MSASSSKTHLSDPQPTVDRIDELARRILSGDILLPKFQREFVWERKRVIALLDSIAKGYPIGSILLWRSRQELKSEKKIADLDVAGQQAEYPYNYLLDGQQRLSTICGALHWEGNDAKSIWNITYDLRTQKFQHPNTMDDPPLHQFRVNRLTTASMFFAQVAQISISNMQDKDLLAVRAKELFDRFKDYKIAVVTLGDMSIADVAPIFERINSQGVPLTRVDLLRAATWSKEFDLIEAIDEIRDDLDMRGFGDLESKSILRNMSASQGGGFSIEQIEHLRAGTPQTHQQAAAVTKKAYQRAVDFLSMELGVVSSSALPYSNQVTVLAEAFRLLPSTPSAGQLRALGEWFWQTSFSGYFSGWNTGQMAQDLERVRDFGEGRILSLHSPSTRPKGELWRERPFRSNNAMSKAFALALAKCGPRDLMTGQAVDTGASLSDLNQKQFHHFFPKKAPCVRGLPASKINAMANIVYLTSASNKKISAKNPSVYLREAQQSLGSDFAAVLESNLISQDALSCALENDYEGFLVARGESVRALVDSLACWPTGIPLTDLIEDDSAVDE